MYKTVIEIITEQAEVSKGKDAVICHNEKTTYSQLIKFSILFYKMIQGFDLKNKAIIIFLPRGKNLIASMLATLNTDGYFVAIDVSYPENRIDEMIKSVNAAVIITDNSLLKRAKRYNVPCVVIDGVLNERSCEKQLICNDCLNSEQLAYCIFTSGSTGHPKGVLIKDNSLYWLIRSFKEKFSLNSYSSILCSSTQCFDMFIVETLVALSLGLTVVLTTEDESKNPKKLLDVINKFGVEIIQMTPSKLKMLQMIDKECLYLTSVKMFVIGGEPFAKNIVNWLKKIYDVKIFNFYGPTEATVWALAHEQTNTDVIALGSPILGTGYVILDENLSKVSNGSVGELMLFGESLAVGYVNDQDLTEKRFVLVDGVRMYKTGDFVRYDAEIEKLIYIGRKDNQVKINGYRVELEEVEKCINQISYITGGVAGVYKDMMNSDVLYLCYSADEEIKSYTIKNYLKQHLPQYMVPALYYQVKTFEYTLNGKIDRSKVVLPTAFDDKNNGKQATAWGKIEGIISNISGIAVSDYFCDLKTIGITTLNLFKVAVQLEEEFKVEFDYKFFSSRNEISVASILHYISDFHKMKE